MSNYWVCFFEAMGMHRVSSILQEKLIAQRQRECAAEIYFVMSAYRQSTSEHIFCDGSNCCIICKAADALIAKVNR